MTETREKVGKPGWRDRLPLIERAVGSIRPDTGPRQDSTATAAPPGAHDATPERAPYVAPNLANKSNLNARHSRLVSACAGLLQRLPKF